MNSFTKGNLLESINSHLQKNIWLYLLSIFCICTGIVLGIYSVKYMGQFEKSDIVRWFTNSINNITTQKISYKEVFFNSFFNYFPIILGLWFLGLTIVGIPVILIIDIIKGYTLGFTFSFIINSFGINGLWLSLSSVLLQNIIFVPCIIICSVLAMEFSLMILKDKVNKKWTNSLLSKACTYSITFIMVLVVMFIGFFIESFITPSTINLIVNNIGMVMI
jgi:stage II sporulation protein M